MSMRPLTKPWLIHVGSTGINLEELSGWEANADRTFLVVHMKNGHIYYLKNQQAEGLLILLEAAAQLHMSDWQRDSRNER